MKIDLNKYSINKKFIRLLYTKNKDLHSLGKVVSRCATATGCPCVVVAFYLAEDIGFTPEVLEIIERLVKFYGYTELIGAPGSYYEAIKE